MTALQAAWLRLDQYVQSLLRDLGATPLDPEKLRRLEDDIVSAVRAFQDSENPF